MREIKFRAWDKVKGSMHDYFQTPMTFWAFIDDSGTPDEFAIMQYTGLKDKNGVEIYEGDILGLVHKKNGLINKQTVIWNDEAAGFDWETTNDDSWPDGFSGFVDEYEVIGNIYETPSTLTMNKEV